MSQEAPDPTAAYYFNTTTGEVEQGLVSGWADRMGPYRTREEAENALSRAAQRNRDWDDADSAWEGDKS